MLTSSSGTNCDLNENEDVGQYRQYAIPSEVMPYYNYPASLVNQNETPLHLIVLTTSSGTHYVLNKHEEFDQYGSFTIPSKIMPYQSYPESLVGLIDTLIALSCQQG